MMEQPPHLGIAKKTMLLRAVARPTCQHKIREMIRADALTHYLLAGKWQKVSKLFVQLVRRKRNDVIDRQRRTPAGTSI